MRKFNVYLRDGRIAKVQAETIRHEGDQYVFDKAGTSEPQFFIASEITGISEADPPQGSQPAPLDEAKPGLLAEVEKQAILQALTECEGNRARTATKLGISRRALQYKLKRWRINDLVF